MFALPAVRRPLGLAASLSVILLALSAAGPAAAADGYLGVMLQEVSPSMGKALQLGDRAGVLVNDVVDDSPAAKAGLQDGDIILELDGRPATNQAELRKAVRSLAPGSKAELVVLRDGRQVKLPVEIGERELGAQWRSLAGGDAVIEFEGLRGLEGLEELKELGQLKGLKDFEWFEDGDTRVMVLPRGEDRGWLGVRMDVLNGQLGEYFGVKDGAGVLVTEVVNDSPAAKAGLRAGDVIVKAGDADVASPEALHKAMGGIKPGEQLSLQVLRKGSRRTVTATLGKMPADKMPQGATAPRQLRFRGFGDSDGETKMTAPRVLRRLNRGDADGEREVIIERRGPAPDDLNDVRQEMEALREELKQLREELKR